MKPKAMYTLTFVVAAAAMFVTSTSAAIAQTSQQVSNTSGSTPVNPSALSATTNILNPGD